MTKEQVMELERKQLHVKYFGSLENPAIIFHRKDDIYIGQVTQIVIPREDIPKLGLGVLIHQEELGNSIWD